MATTLTVVYTATKVLVTTKNYSFTSSQCTNEESSCSSASKNSYRSKEAFVRFAHGISAANATWYSVNELQSDIPSLLLLMETSEDNTHAILASTGVGKFTKGGLFRFLATEMNDFMYQFSFRDTCELTKYKVMGQKKWFLQFGMKNFNAIKNPGSPAPRECIIIQQCGPLLQSSFFGPVVVPYVE
eukprot:9938506-Ditylum_brightwellii.AAC.1